MLALQCMWLASCPCPPVVHSAAIHVFQFSAHCVAFRFVQMQQQHNRGRGRGRGRVVAGFSRNLVIVREIAYKRRGPGRPLCPRLPLTELNLTCHVGALVRRYSLEGRWKGELIATHWLWLWRWLWRLDNRSEPLFERRAAK